MESAEFAKQLNIQLTYLFVFCQKINEIDTVAAVFGEFRGAQDPGWNTMVTAYEVSSELKGITSSGTGLNIAEIRFVLCLYAHLAEAGGVYEGLLNTIRVAQLKPYNLWPFQDLVRVRKSPRAVIGPNSNKMFRHLAEAAESIGMPRLSKLLEEAFRDDIRNGIAHADYVLGQDGLRLRHRNGGHPLLVPFEEISETVQKGHFFFELLHQFYHSVMRHYRPARTVVGRFSENYPMPWTIEWKEDGRFSICSSSPGPVTDGAYIRQQMINSRLNGRMVAMYKVVGADDEIVLVEGIRLVGFEPLLVEVSDENRYALLVQEIDENSLWDATGNVHEVQGWLVLTPLGYRRIRNVGDFQTWLPNVDDVEVE